MNSLAKPRPPLLDQARAACRSLLCDPPLGSFHDKALSVVWRAFLVVLWLGAALSCSAFFLRTQRHAALESLWGQSLSSMERSFAWRGAGPAFDQADALAAQGAAGAIALGLPSLAWTRVYSFAHLAGYGPNSGALSFGPLCLVDHGLTEDGQPFMRLAMGGARDSDMLAFAFAAGHEVGHCSFRRAARPSGSPSTLAAAAFALPAFAPPKQARAAEDWLSRAWAESYSDLIGLAAVARALPKDDPRFYSIGAYLIGRRTLAHLSDIHGAIMASRGPGPGFDMAELDEHFTQFALHSGLEMGQRKLASMDGPSLESWAMSESLRSTAAGARGSPSFAWLFAPARALHQPRPTSEERRAP